MCGCRESMSTKKKTDELKDFECQNGFQKCKF